MKSLTRYIYFLTLFLFISESLLSQEQNKIDSVKAIYESQMRINKDTIQKNSTEILPVMDKKSATGAIWRSLVLPGWGQLYVESYWKAPLFTIAAGILVYSIIWNNNHYQDYQSQYDKLVSITPTNSELLILNRYKEYYRDNRDQSAFYLAGVYLIAAVDAYVGSHLYDFNVDDTYNFNILPGKYGGIALNLYIIK